jgi:hypothetical protein
VAAGTLRQRLERVTLQSSAHARDAARNAVREEVLRRMWDVSTFVKLVKQQFTQWFNGAHQRRGTLWEQRFKSVLVEGPPVGLTWSGSGAADGRGGGALATMACYIDLNPVRAGMVGHPGEYRWCGYGAAMGGDRRARGGLGLVVRALVPGEVQRPWALVQRAYYGWLMQEGIERKYGDGTVKRRGMKRDRAEKPALAEALRRRVRYFSDGGALGSREFIEGVFAAHREAFGEKRTTGARPMRHIQAPGLHVLRDLQVDVLGQKPENAL